MGEYDKALIDAVKKGESFFKIAAREKYASYSDTQINNLFNFYKNLNNFSNTSSFTDSFKSDPFGKGTLSSGIDFFSDAVTKKFGALGTVYSALSNVVKGVADLSEKVVATQMGVEDPNSASKIIFDLVKEGGINPLKLLASGVEEAFNQVLNQLKQESVLLTEVGSKTGLVSELGGQLREDMVEASIEGARYGATLLEIGQFYIDLVENSGKFSLINQDVYDSAIPLSRALNMNLSELSSTLFDYENVGVGLSKSIENLEGATNRSLSLGLSARKVTQTMNSDISKLNEYGFQNGVRGLERMAQRSIEFRMNMESVFKIADKVFNPEGALDMVANLQALGGAFGDFNDPLKLMYMATNNVEGLQDALIGASESLATYNEEQGRFEITGINLRRAKAMAEELGVSYQDLSKGAIAAAERSSASIALMSTGLMMKEEDREFLTNLARMEDGEMKIVVPKSLMDEMGGQTEISLERLSETQKQVLLSNREAFKEMDTKEIAMNQLTEIQQVSRGIDVIASYARVRAADYLQDKAKNIGGSMLDDLKLNVDKFSTQLSRETKSREITNTSPQEIRNYTSAQINNPNQMGGNILPNTNNNQSQPSNTNVEGRVVHVIQFNSQAVLDPIAREMQKNPEVANSIVSSLINSDDGYLSVKIPESK
jgi:hypothetical protein